MENTKKDKGNKMSTKGNMTEMPTVVKEIAMSEKNYMELLSKGIEFGKAGTQECNDIESDIVDSLKDEVARGEATFEEKKFYYSQMAEAAKRKEQKDSETKEYAMSIFRLGGEVLLGSLLIATGVYFGYRELKTVA